MNDGIHYKIASGVWYARKLCKTIGVIGLLGSFLLVFTSLVYVLDYLPKVKQLQINQLNLEYIQNQKFEKINLPSAQFDQADNVISQAQIKAFYILFPQDVALSDLLNKIQKTALKQKLVLNRGDYKLTTKQQKKQCGDLVCYEIQLPVSGPYLKIRAFITEVLQQIPALTLADVQFKRENSSVANVDARLVFLLLLKGERWK